jgi:hypothetical protein
MDKKKLVMTAVKAVAVASLIHSMRPQVARADGCGQVCAPAMNCAGAPLGFCEWDGSPYYCGEYNPPNCYDPQGGFCDDGSFC